MSYLNKYSSLNCYSYFGTSFLVTVAEDEKHGPILRFDTSKEDTQSPSSLTLSDVKDTKLNLMWQSAKVAGIDELNPQITYRIYRVEGETGDDN